MSGDQLEGRAARENLHQRQRELEQREAALSTAVAQLQEEKKRHDELLEALRRGVFVGRQGRSLIAWLMLGLLVAGGISAAFWLKVEPKRTRRRVVERVLVPHLLVTSEPSRAPLSVDGVAAGRTPKLLRIRGPASPVIEVRAPGHAPRRKRIEIQAHRGAHWHVALRPAAGQP